MIGEKYKKHLEQEKKGGKNGFKKEHKRVLKRVQMVFKKGINGFEKVIKIISLYSRILKGQERPHSLFKNFSSLSSPFSPYFHPFFTILGKNGKKRPSKFFQRGKERTHSFPIILFTFPFSACLGCLQ